MTTDGPSAIHANPMGLRLARTYGVTPASPPASPTTPPAPAAKAAPPEARTTALDAKAAGPVGRLVAAVVPGAVRFDDAGEARPTAAALPFYTRPTDRNAAATGVHAGRMVDVEG